MTGETNVTPSRHNRKMRPKDRSPYGMCRIIIQPSPLPYPGKTPPYLLDLLGEALIALFELLRAALSPRVARLVRANKVSRQRRVGIVVPL